MSIWQIVRNVHLIFVEKAEIVANAKFPLYKRKKVWYNKTVVGQTDDVWLAFFVVEKQKTKNMKSTWFFQKSMV